MAPWQRACAILCCCWASAEAVVFDPARATLEGAIIVTRHGDRSALHPVPKALTPGLSGPQRERWLGVPLGDLTARGEEQHRRLGARSRCRYDALLGDRYACLTAPQAWSLGGAGGVLTVLALPQV